MPSFADMAITARARCNITTRWRAYEGSSQALVLRFWFQAADGPGCKAATTLSNTARASLVPSA
jgi:hypothetical protein